MADFPVDPAETFLTARQEEVVTLRWNGRTQPEIADRFGTSVANVSAIEKRARDNVDRASRTIDLANGIRAAFWVAVEGGDHLREVVEAVYAGGDDAGIKVPYSDPELSTYLDVRLRDRLDGRRLTEGLRVGVTADGDVVIHPGNHAGVRQD